MRSPVRQLQQIYNPLLFCCIKHTSLEDQSHIPFSAIFVSRRLSAETTTRMPEISENILLPIANKESIEGNETIVDGQHI